ncbi:MAG: ATP-binding protein, partial [Myxococcaceae bacterium]
KTEFFANAQHELRTPLTLLLAPVETLSRDSRLPEDVREELSASLRSGYRLLKLVNDVLDLSKVEAGRLRLQVAAVDLSRLMREAVRPFTAQLRGRNVELRFELPEKLELVADPERLEQVLLNILSNAVRFTPDGGTIQLGASASNSSVELYIENSGEQIPEPELEKLFQRFAQSSSASMRRYGTTGLGLSVVKELIELHGGTVSAKNVENGVRFILSVPMTASPEHFPVSEAMKPSSRELRQYEVSGESDAARAAPPHSTELTHEKPLLLIAEDNSELRSYIVRHLRHDYEILEASDGAMAFKLATEKLPDLILSDLMMPELSGAELCAKVKAHPQLQSTPFILLTARSDMNTRLSGLEEGADDFLVKPFSLDEVKARLRTHLRVRMLNQRAAHREKLAALGTMIAGVAHEMRNPLNGIVNSLRPLRELLKAPEPEVSELLDIAIDSCERVEKISTQLLRQAHPGEWTRSEVDVAENVRTAAALMAFKTSSGPNLVVDLDAAKSARVIGEAGALNQVWVNLLDNAIQAAGPTGQVTVTVEQSAKQISVDVSDNGPGIPPGVLSRIFDPFFTTKRVGTGTGLGLSFVRQIVETHGGSVSVQSSPGEGARFRVTLPAMNAAMGEVRAS